jgi:hypothetical protein
MIKAVCNLGPAQSDLCPILWAQYYCAQAAHWRMWRDEDTSSFFSIRQDLYSRVFSAVMDLIGESGLSPHGLKSGASTYLALEGFDSETISRHLRWRTHSMQAHYSSNTLQEALQMQRAMFVAEDPILLDAAKNSFRSSQSRKKSKWLPPQ